ncbi:MAG: class I SAM-dependent methyltransferase [bacterium]|nr:class I SAM-dependent methyltransferase [bacterium]
MIKKIVKKIFNLFGVRLIMLKKEEIPKEFVENYKRNLKQLEENPRGYNIFRSFRYDAGVHPKDQIDAQYEFLASHLSKLGAPLNILDIGSHRHFLLGLLINHRLTTIDVRERRRHLANEKIITCDAKDLKVPDNEFDVVTSVCSLEHFGLGRYGDVFDLDADKKAFKEMVRVLKPGGHLIFTTVIHNSSPSIVFNAEKIYNREMINEFCSGLICIEEKFYSYKNREFCSFENIIAKPNGRDIYCGCWLKPSK